MQFGDDFDALLERFSPEKESPIAVAVSGGSDSLALLLLLDQWARRCRRSLIVLTVNHQLREDAAQEADFVGEICAGLGWLHETLNWETPRPGQAAARQARYELLSETARQRGAGVVLTGHTFDDVLETALIRRRRGVRNARVAGPVMAAPMPIWPDGRGLTLLRPLVHSTRHDLRTFLESRDRSWVEDPSNKKTQFERVRVRDFLARHPGLAKIAANAVEDMQAQRAAAMQTLSLELMYVRVEADALIDTAGAMISVGLIQLLARLASGQTHMPRQAATQTMLSSLNEVGQRQTLGGAWFQRSDTGFLIGRDPGPAEPGIASDVFDGRFIRDEANTLPDPTEMAFLVRQSAPPDAGWREIVSDRLAHVIRCYQTPRLNPVQR